MVVGSDTWKLFLRYQAQNERLYRRAIEEYERVKALRAVIAECPDEPIFDPQPQQTETTSTPPNEPIPEPAPDGADERLSALIAKKNPAAPALPSASACPATPSAPEGAAPCG